VTESNPPSREDLPDATRGNDNRLAREVENILRRREEQEKERDELLVKAWTNPGPHLQDELERLDKRRDELIEDSDLVFAEVKAELAASKERRASLQEKRREHWEHQYDLQKHVTTLSTASILGLGALTSLFPGGTDLAPSVAPSLICFLGAIVFAVFGMATSNAEHLAVTAEDGTKSRGVMAFFSSITRGVFALCYVGSLTAFCFGVVLIVKFVLEQA